MRVMMEKTLQSGCCWMYKCEKSDGGRTSNLKELDEQGGLGGISGGEVDQLRMIIYLGTLQRVVFGPAGATIDIIT